MNIPNSISIADQIYVILSQYPLIVQKLQRSFDPTESAGNEINGLVTVSPGMQVFDANQTPNTGIALQSVSTVVNITHTVSSSQKTPVGIQDQFSTMETLINRTRTILVGLEISDFNQVLVLVRGQALPKESNRYQWVDSYSLQSATYNR